MRIVVIVALALSACYDAPVEKPASHTTQETDVRVEQSIKNKVDVLFMIDNSTSMAPMQLELRARFGDFFQVFQELAQKGTYADMHIGVTTSDYGAGPTANVDSMGNGCAASPGGQRGVLQVRPSKYATNPPAGCQPPTGAPFISYQFTAGGAMTNLPNGSDARALVDEFTCMASVGAAGCGFEHQLESVYAALHNTTDNAAFLRDDALLTVVFVTNEDDGSAPPTAKFYEVGADPATYGQYTTYRQTRFAVECGGMPIPYGMPLGPLQGCAAAPNPSTGADLAYDVQRYIDFFTLPKAKGGVKDDPRDVILVGIDGFPEVPFQTVLIASNQPAGVQRPCATPALSGSCIEALAHSCQNMLDPDFFADPGVRLNTVLRAAGNHQISSICGDDVSKTPNFSSALEQLANLIKGHIGEGCIDSPFAHPDDPDCVVEDISDLNRSAIDEIPRCDRVNSGTYPCWRLEAKDPAKCIPVCAANGDPGQHFGVTIDRGPGGTPPPHASARVACSTLVIPKDPATGNLPTCGPPL